MKIKSAQKCLNYQEDLSTPACQQSSFSCILNKYQNIFRL